MLEAKLNQCEQQLAEVKQQMKNQKGVAYKNSQRRAFTILKRRKIYAAQLNNMTNQQFNLDQMKFNSDAIQNTIDTVSFLPENSSRQPP